MRPISSGDGRRDERDLAGFDHSSPRVNVLEPVSSRRQLYEWPVAANANAAAAAAQAVPASSEYVSLFDQQVREAEKIKRLQNLSAGLSLPSFSFDMLH